MGYVRYASLQSKFIASYTVTAGCGLRLLQKAIRQFTWPTTAETGALRNDTVRTIQAAESHIGASDRVPVVHPIWKGVKRCHFECQSDKAEAAV